MKTALYIPTKCKVGFNKREDTYTKKLGYVIYHDGKVWRKENSWESWREKVIGSEEFEEGKMAQYNHMIKNYTSNFNHMVNDLNKGKTNRHFIDSYKSEVALGLDTYLEKLIGPYDKYVYRTNKITKDKTMTPIEFENVPTEGFVLNKKAGGTNYGWNQRATYCRVYDPRGFEFEITIQNLLYILQETNSMKGKGLEGSFVYSWDGKDLVLLPTTALEYVSAQTFTKLSGKTIGVKDMVEGCVYIDKYSLKYIYLGKYNLSEKAYGNLKVSEDYVFVEENGTYKMSKNVSFLVEKMSDEVVSNFAELMTKLNESKFFNKITSFEMDAYSPLKKINSSYVSHVVFEALNDDWFAVTTVTTYGEYNYAGYSRDYSIKGYSTISNKKIKFNTDGSFVLKTNKANNRNLISLDNIKSLSLYEIEAIIENKTYKLKV